MPTYRKPSSVITTPRFRFPFGGPGPVIPHYGLYRPKRFRYGLRIPHGRQSGIKRGRVTKWYPQQQSEYSGLKPAQPRIIVNREYVEAEDMFERDLVEDAEFEARDFDDELYLD